jgi:hypothetical protein
MSMHQFLLYTVTIQLSKRTTKDPHDHATQRGKDHMTCMRDPFAYKGCMRPLGAYTSRDMYARPLRIHTLKSRYIKRISLIVKIALRSHCSIHNLVFGISSSSFSRNLGDPHCLFIDCSIVLSRDLVNIASVNSVLLTS